MAQAARPGATVSAPCDLAQLTTPTYARGRLARLRKEAGRKGSGRCEMARACSAFHEPDQRGCHRSATQAPRLALARLQLSAGLSLWAALCADARHPPLSRLAPAIPLVLTLQPSPRRWPSPSGPHPPALTPARHSPSAPSSATPSAPSTRWRPRLGLGLGLGLGFGFGLRLGLGLG